jgi:hypothetical protein
VSYLVDLDEKIRFVLHNFFLISSPSWPFSIFKVCKIVGYNCDDIVEFKCPAPSTSKGQPHKKLGVSKEAEDASEWEDIDGMLLTRQHLQSNRAWQRWSSGPPLLKFWSAHVKCSVSNLFSFQ